MKLMTDGLREADEDNPRGYLEFEPVKSLLKDSRWLRDGCGKAIKIVAPLLGALPPGLPCKVILSERDLDEVLDSQERMIARRKEAVRATPERRQMLKDEYARTMARVQVMLSKRSATEVLLIKHRDAINDAEATALEVNAFLGGTLNVAKMATAVDPSLHRNR
jgi:hypothetical protein